MLAPAHVGPDDGLAYEPGYAAPIVVRRPPGSAAKGWGRSVVSVLLAAPVLAGAAFALLQII